MKRVLVVTAGARSARVAFYPGTGAAALEQAIRQALALGSGPLLLRDADGDAVALSDQLPDGLALAVESDDREPLSPIPGPPPYPVVGNLFDLGTPADFVARAKELMAEYGPFVRLKLPGKTLYVTNDADVVRDLVARQPEFPKVVSTDPRGPLNNIRNPTTGAGLFTADDAEEIWGVAHRVLMPAFGKGALAAYFPRMVEVCDELVALLLSLPPERDVPITELTTRVTFETIGAAGMSTRFGAIGGTLGEPALAEPLPAFVQAMVDMLLDAQTTTTSLLPPSLRPLARWKRERADAVLNETVDALIARRREAIEREEVLPNDMLQTMLTARDRVSGQRLPDDNIRHQLITLLVAGHETTSGTLSYALHELCRNAHVEARLADEVDRVLGTDPDAVPTMRQVDDLEYVGRVLKETLRIHPPAPASGRTPPADTVLAGRYAIGRREKVVVLFQALHTDPRWWGDDALRFDPDRFLPEAVAARHPNAYHPFGFGMRSCIGFQFALIEAKLILARLYQRFRPKLADPGYVLRHEVTLTTKPAGLRLRFERRPAVPRRAAEPRPSTEEVPRAEVAGAALAVRFGSNMGASQELATRLARDALARGIAARVADLDAGPFPTEGAAVVVCSTYNGEPPDNAARFSAWLDAPGPRLDGLRFAVLGCGNSQWRSSYQRFPRSVHDRLVARGAVPLVPRGECDADGDFDRSAEAWIEAFWPAVAQALGSRAEAGESTLRYEVQVVNYAGAADNTPFASRCSVHGRAAYATVLASRELLSDAAARSTRHIELRLPDGLSYEAGDHLAVFPENPLDLVKAAAQRCGRRVTDVVVLAAKGGGPAHLPTGVPVTVRELLGRHVDLAGPCTVRELRALARRTACPPERDSLLALAGGQGTPPATLVEALQRFPSVDADLSLLLSVRPLIKARFYSIASAPGAGPCALTVGVRATDVDGRAVEGLCSNFLASLEPGATFRMAVSAPAGRFRMPEDPARDVILVGAGTGVAPLRGFVQHRARQRAQGPTGRTWLFFGCRNPDEDWLYREELEAHAAAGWLDLAMAFSRPAEGPSRYVQHRVEERADDLREALRDGAVVLVCGDGRRMAPAVRRAFEGVTGEDLAPLLGEGRYVEDVWGG